MFLRFQTKALDPRSGHPTGILAAAHDLRDSGKLDPGDEAWLGDSLAYFERHLKMPPPRKEAPDRHGIRWFREHSSMVARVRELAAFMDTRDIFIEIIQTEDPGIIYYEDSHQVVAKRVNHRKRPQAGNHQEPGAINPMLLRTFVRKASPAGIRKRPI